MTSAPPRNRGRQGFTLIELMIVVVIIGILAAIAVPKFNNVTRAAKEAEASPILKQLFTLQMRYKQQNEKYATVIDSLEGGTSSFSEGKYYDFTLSSDPAGTSYLACATPKTGYEFLDYFTIDDQRNVVRKKGSC